MKKLIKLSKDMIVGSTILGVGASVVSKVGGNAKFAGTMSKYYPTIATVGAGGTMLGMLKNLNKTKKKRR